MKFGIADPASIELYRANTHASAPIVLRRKRCACGRVVTAKQLAQQDGCDACARAKATDLMMRDMAALQGGTFPEPLKNELTSLGTEFALMTQFTSFVAVECLTQ